MHFLVAMMPAMNLIERDELKEMLDQGHTFKLVMTLGAWEFQQRGTAR